MKNDYSIVCYRDMGQRRFAIFDKKTSRLSFGRKSEGFSSHSAANLYIEELVYWRIRSK